MAEQIPLKDEQIRVRVPGTLKTRINAVFARYGVTEATLVRDALEAILDHIERTRGYCRPVMMVQADPVRAVAEEKSPYEHGLKKGPEPGKTPDKTRRRSGDGPTVRVSKSAETHRVAGERKHQADKLRATG